MRIGVLRQGHRRELRLHVAGRPQANVDDLWHARELERGHRTEVGLDQDVAGAHVRLRLERAASHHDAEHLVRDVERRVQAIAPGEREAHVHHDQAIHAHLSRKVDGEVVHEPAVHEQPAVEFDGRQHARCRHARAQHGHQVAAAEHDGFAGLEIRGERAELGGQAIEILHVGHPDRGRAQHLRDPVALDQAERQHDAPVLAHAERAASEDVAIILLAPIGQVAPRRAIADHLLPVECAEYRLDLRAAQTRRIQATDDRAHAGSRDRIDRYAQFFKRANYADVGATPRTTAAQHESDAGPRPRHRSERHVGTCRLARASARNDGVDGAGSHRDRQQADRKGQRREPGNAAAPLRAGSPRDVSFQHRPAPETVRDGNKRHAGI